jgi:putative ABC transport system permease protein
MTRAYSEISAQSPNDLALLSIDTLLSRLRQDYPDLLWTARITFGGLLDVPDEQGETKEQAPVSGMGVNLLSADSPEWNILNIRTALVRGEFPKRHGDILIAAGLADKLHLQPGQQATLISSTMYGSMSFVNFKIAGIVRLGIGSLDRSAIIADLPDIQQALDMAEGAGTINGFFPDDLYHQDRAEIITANFNARYQNSAHRFSPIMATLRHESGLADYLDLVESISGKVLAIFIIVMSIVLWNAGLIGGLRRYGEIGLRLAMGEDKEHVTRSMIVESLMIGIFGSLMGTAIGLTFAYFLQIHGLDIGSMMENSTMMISDVIRAQVNPLTYVIGFIPGVLATFLGSAISGIGIFKRQTSQLFKELET